MAGLGSMKPYSFMGGSGSGGQQGSGGPQRIQKFGQWTNNPYYKAPEQSFDFPLGLGPESSSRTGMGGGYQQMLSKTMVPYIEDMVKNRNQYIDQYTQEGMGLYQQQMQNLLSGMIPSTIQNLAKRGIIDSSAGENVLEDVQSKALRGATEKGYQTAVQAAMMKAQIPDIFGQLMSLGKTTTQSSSDPTPMYHEIGTMLRAMM